MAPRLVERFLKTLVEVAPVADFSERVEVRRAAQDVVLGGDEAEI